MPLATELPAIRMIASVVALLVVMSSVTDKLPVTVLIRMVPDEVIAPRVSASLFTYSILPVFAVKLVMSLPELVNV